MTAPQVWSSWVPGNVAVAGASEAVIGTLVIGSMPQHGNLIRLVCSATVAIDTSATSIILKIREDSISGTVLATVEYKGAAADTDLFVTLPVNATDQLGEFANKVYVLTSTAASAAAGYNASAVSMMAMVGPG